MKSNSLTKAIFLAVFFFMTFITPAMSENILITEVLHPDYMVFYVVGVLVILAFILVKTLKRNEVRTKRLNSVRRFNRHRSLNSIK